MTKFDAVVLADGDFPTHAVPLSILEGAQHVICCDGAISHYPQAEIVIGDGDSVPDLYRHKLIQIDEQDDNDLTKATRYCLQQGWKKIAYLGCTGKREDHTLGNISLLMRYYRDWGIEGLMLTSHGFFTPSQGDQCFTSQAGQQVSIFNFGCTRIESAGLKWNSYAYQEWWQGTLNETLSDHFTIHADGWYLVYQTYKNKKTSINNG
ncbi:MAG: thiamine diphosphokinase [Prevotella sp.]|nr:thiamine diphosphokinase [Prevotella sp.]